MKKHRRRQSRILIAAFAAAALVLSACSSGGDDEQSGGSGGVFRFAGTVPSTYDPAKSPNYNHGFLTPVYQSLLTRDKNGQVIPQLATDYELSEDGTRFDLTLREGVEFQDGEPFNAEAVKLTLERAKNVEGSLVASQLAVIDSIEILDETHVRLHLDGPAGALPNILASEAGMMISPKAIEEGVDLSAEPVGTGPYTLTSSSDSEVIYDAWDGYWNADEVKNSRFVYTLQVDESARLRAVRSGQIDGSGIAGSQIDAAREAGLQVEVGNTTNVVYLRLNPENVPAFREHKVRQAVTRAIHRQDIGENSDFAGACNASVQPFPEGYWAHVDGLDEEPELSYDVEAAKRLLAEAGYPDGFSLTLTAASFPSYVSLAQILQAQLGRIGIDVEVNVQDIRTVQAADIAGELEAQIGQTPAGRPDPSRLMRTEFMPNGLRNYAGIEYPDVERLFTESLQSTEAAERAGPTQEFIETVVKYGPTYHSICSLDQTFALSQDVSGFETTLLQEYLWQGISVD